MREGHTGWSVPLAATAEERNKAERKARGQNAQKLGC